MGATGCNSQANSSVTVCTAFCISQELLHVALCPAAITQTTRCSCHLFSCPSCTSPTSLKQGKNRVAGKLCTIWSGMGRLWSYPFIFHAVGWLPGHYWSAHTNKPTKMTRVQPSKASASRKRMSTWALVPRFLTSELPSLGMVAECWAVHSGSEVFSFCSAIGASSNCTAQLLQHGKWTLL